MRLLTTKAAIAAIIAAAFLPTTLTAQDEVGYYLDPSLDVEIESVVVSGRIKGNYIKLEGIGKEEMISFAGLCKMACCNLAESFENSAAVTVGYSDAISGARQIQMLGLAGTYTQMLDESRPVMRGLSAPYALSYTPGMWLNSIQISKGISSVTSGHEAITGQINVEHRKPTDSQKLFLNLFINSELRPEANISTSQKVGKSEKLSTIVMAHISGDTGLIKSRFDHDQDGFRNHPLSTQLSVANRWLYSADNGTQIRWGIKALGENRTGGMVDYDSSMRDNMVEMNLYGSEIENRSFNAYFKAGIPLGTTIYDIDSGEVLRSNLAFVADFDYFDEDAYFGLNDYVGNERSVTTTLMYSKYFSPRSSLIVGASALLQKIDEKLNNTTAWSETSNTYDLSRSENELGIYGEYTYNLADKFSLIAGLRGDYNTYFNTFNLTPRGQIKWSITPSTTLRASAGVGHRTTNVITDNIGALATGRQIIFEDIDGNSIDSSFNRQEHAATFGGSLTQNFGIIKSGDATLSLDYFRTNFSRSIIVDQEWDSTTIRIYGTDAPAYTNTYQADFSWTPTTGLDLFATFRYTDSKITLTRPDGSYYTTDRALISQFKTLLNIQYATKMRRWVFDFTAQYNGKSRLPVQDGAIGSSSYSPAYPLFFAQVSRRIGSWELYVGCENIANYTQKDPILGADTPFSSEFNSSVIWGPLMGRKYYAGLRFNLY
ncbi:MAG: TonB-dependent receptor [Rikenellaceae bacterium]